MNTSDMKYIKYLYNGPDPFFGPRSSSESSLYSNMDLSLGLVTWTRVGCWSPITNLGSGPDML